MENEKSFFVKNRRILVLVISLLVLVGGAFLCKGCFLFNPQREADKHFVPYQFTKTEGNLDGKQFDRAVQYYVDGKYRNAIPLFTEVKNSRGKFFAGICYYMEGETDAAIVRLRAVHDAHDSYAAEATWYLALSLMKSDRRDEAVKFFNEFIESYPEHAENENAVKLVKKISAE